MEADGIDAYLMGDSGALTVQKATDDFGADAIEKMANQTYPETALLKQVKGVGDLIATA
jgi:transposase